MRPLGCDARDARSRATRPKANDGSPRADGGSLHESSAMQRPRLAWSVSRGCTSISLALAQGSTSARRARQAASPSTATRHEQPARRITSFCTSADASVSTTRQRSRRACSACSSASSRPAATTGTAARGSRAEDASRAVASSGAAGALAVAPQPVMRRANSAKATDSELCRRGIAAGGRSASAASARLSGAIGIGGGSERASKVATPTLAWMFGSATLVRR